MFYYDLSFLPTYVGYCPDKKSWKKEMKRLGCTKEPYPKSDGRCTRFQCHDKTTVIVCFNKRKDTTDVQIIGIIAHEVSHVIDYIFEDIGEENPSSEFKAYLTQFLVQSIYNDWKKIESKES